MYVFEPDPATLYVIPRNVLPLIVRAAVAAPAVLLMNGCVAEFATVYVTGPAVALPIWFVLMFIVDVTAPLLAIASKMLFAFIVFPWMTFPVTTRLPAALVLSIAMKVLVEFE